MKSFISTFLCLIVFFLGQSFSELKAQENEDPLNQKFNNTLSFVMTQPIFMGMRLEYERKLPNRNLWLQLAPMHFKSFGQFQEAEAFWGAGAGLGIKTFFIEDWHYQGGFVMAAVDYNYFDFETIGTVLEESEWNGFPVFVPKEKALHQYVDRIKVMCSVGVQGVLWRFKIKARMGIGYQYSSIEVPEGSVPLMDDYFYELAYSGYVYNAAICIGVAF